MTESRVCCIISINLEYLIFRNKNNMKLKLILPAFVIAACGVTLAVTSYNKNKQLSHLMYADVEAISACESIGWWDNDGNCVNDDRGHYFCKTDTWYQVTDCIR